MNKDLSRLAVLKDRAYMLSQVRAFFAERHVLEVDCPILTAGASIDANIDLIPAIYSGLFTRYMHSSPEYGMKRLLTEGIGDIYQLSHVFRDGESSTKHNPEFMMAEWYRIGMPFEELIHETLDFVRLFLGSLPAHIISYREVFLQYAGFDYRHASIPFLLSYLQEKNILPYEGIEKDGKDALLNIVLGAVIEPHLGKEGLCVLAYYPSTQAALAKTRWYEDEHVAERFEIYYHGIELCNGYHELTNAQEQRKRFIESNQTREALGKQKLPIDEAFLTALNRGLPNCCGVAVGFDRLMMLRHQTSHIADVVPFVWMDA